MPLKHPSHAEWFRAPLDVLAELRAVCCRLRPVGGRRVDPLVGRQAGPRRDGDTQINRAFEDEAPAVTIDELGDARQGELGRRLT